MSPLPVNGDELWDAGCAMSRAKAEVLIAGIGNDTERLRRAEIVYNAALMAFAELTLTTHHAAAQRREKDLSTACEELRRPENENPSPTVEYREGGAVVSLGQGTSKVDIMPEDLIEVNTEREP